MGISTENRLDQLVIASPCTEPWEGMRGNDRTRHCSACRLDVHNIAAMTRDEAEHLLQTSLRHAGDRLCARIYRRPDGTILTRDCVPERGRVARRLRRMRVALTSALALLGFAGCRNAAQERVSIPTAGVVAPYAFDPTPPAESAGEAPAPEAAPSEAQAGEPAVQK